MADFEKGQEKERQEIVAYLKTLGLTPKARGYFVAAAARIEMKMHKKKA